MNTDSDISLFSPVGTPGVSDEIIFSTVFNTIANGEDGVVESYAASIVGNDTVKVVLEGVFSSVDGNGDGLKGDGSLKLGSGVSLHHGVLQDFDWSGVS